MDDQQDPDVLTEILSLLQEVTKAVQQRCLNSDDILHALTEIKAALSGIRIIQMASGSMKRLKGVLLSSTPPMDRSQMW